MASSIIDWTFSVVNASSFFSDFPHLSEDTKIATTTLNN